MASVFAVSCQNHQFALNNQKKKTVLEEKLPGFKPDVVQFSGKAQPDDTEKRLRLAKSIILRPDMTPYVSNFIGILNEIVTGSIPALVAYSQLAGQDPEFIRRMPQGFLSLSQQGLIPVAMESLIATVADRLSKEELEQLLTSNRFEIFEMLEEKEVLLHALQHPEFINTLAGITASCLPTSFKFRTVQLSPAAKS
jgi:hypothetical protein